MSLDDAQQNARLVCRKAGISQATYFNWKKKYDTACCRGTIAALRRTRTRRGRWTLCTTNWQPARSSACSRLSTHSRGSRRRWSLGSGSIPFARCSFGFERGEEALHRRIVPDVAAAHRADDTVISHQSLELLAGVLAAGNSVALTDSDRTFLFSTAY